MPFAPDPPLARGAQGEPVAALQHALRAFARACRFTPPAEDGVFGMRTAAAVGAFRQTVLGKQGYLADAATLAALGLPVQVHSDTRHRQYRVTFRPGARDLGRRRRFAAHQAAAPQGFINGQGLGVVKALPYGAKWQLGYNGCGPIAVYNALLALGNPHTLAAAAGWGERHLRLGGRWGTAHGQIPKLFRGLGYRVHVVRTRRKMDAAIRSADGCILTYWLKKPFCSGLHIVFVQRLPAGGFLVYNRYDRLPEVCRCDDLAALFAADGGAPLTLCCIYR